MSPNFFFREISKNDSKISAFTVIYSCKLIPLFAWFDTMFSEFSGGLPILLVLVLNVATSVKIMGKISARRTSEKEKMTNKKSQSGTNKVCAKRSRIISDAKISLILILLAVFYVIFIGGGNVLWHYQHYSTQTKNDVRLSKLLLLIVKSFYALNGCINAFLMLIFPSMRQSLLTGLKKIFNRLFCASLHS